MQNFHFLYSCNTSRLWDPASTACNLQELLRFFNSGCGYQFTSIAATSLPCWGKQQFLMFLSGSGGVRYQPDKAARHICFCHSWQQPAADKRWYFQLVFFCSDCFKSMDMVFLVSVCIECSLLCEAVGGSRCPSIFLTPMVHGPTSHTGETEQTCAKPFRCRRKNFAATLCLCQLTVRGAEHNLFKLFVFHVVFLPGWVGGKRGPLFNFNIHIGFSTP